MINVLGLSGALLLTGCGNARPVLVLPPAERAEPVPLPVVPVGEAVCEGRPCLSDAETATLIADYDQALRAANAELAWLKAWVTAAGR